MPMSVFEHGFMKGVIIRQSPTSHSGTGKIFWVCNRSGQAEGDELATKVDNNPSDSNRGTYLRPLKTIAAALALCKPNRGDSIYIGPGHAETVSSATAMNLNVADVALIGFGSGTSRPTITLNTATGATINVTANDVRLQNIVIVANFAAIVSAFTLTTAKNFTLDRCEVRDTSSVLNFVSVVTTDTTSHDADGLTISNTDVFGLGTSANTNLVNMLGTNDRVTIKNVYQQNLSTTQGGALMPIATGKIVTNLLVQSNIINATQASGNSAGVLITTNGTTLTGELNSNHVHALGTTTQVLVTASSGVTFFDNMYVHTADKSGFLLPLTDS